ncbi:hypothetical protein niasHT_002218 [Heterodera trifolii]|uniref:Uncharacterized protein n=1 Tax=Heterodera trifolii TaxID=157864 RepID=A0ABD2LS58_9BILA
MFGIMCRPVLFMVCAFFVLFFVYATKPEPFMPNHAPTDENEIPNIGKAEPDAIGRFGHEHPRNSDTETEKPAHALVDQLSMIGALFFGQVLIAILVNHPPGKTDIQFFRSLIIVLVSIVVSVEAPSFGAGGFSISTPDSSVTDTMCNYDYTKVKDALFVGPMKWLPQIGVDTLVSFTGVAKLPPDSDGKVAGTMCDCGWAKCHPKPGTKGSTCCAENSLFVCCKDPQIEHDLECKAARETCECGWAECIPKAGERASPCCAEHYRFGCCEKASRIPPKQIAHMDDCKKAAKTCNCGWYNCIKKLGQPSTACCAEHYEFACCTNPPPRQLTELAECESARQKCPSREYACLPEPGHTSQSCCGLGHKFTCMQIEYLSNYFFQTPECDGKFFCACRNPYVVSPERFVGRCCDSSVDCKCCETDPSVVKPTLLSPKRNSEECLKMIDGMPHCSCPLEFTTGILKRDDLFKSVNNPSPHSCVAEPGWPESACCAEGSRLECCAFSEKDILAAKFSLDIEALEDNLSMSVPLPFCAGVPNDKVPHDCILDTEAYGLSTACCLDPSDGYRHIIKQIKHNCCPNNDTKRDCCYDAAQCCNEEITYLIYKHGIVSAIGDIIGCALMKKNGVLEFARSRFTQLFSFAFNESKDILVAKKIETQFPLVKTVRRECTKIAASCPCGYGSCVFVTKKQIADVCCAGPYEFTCCHNVPPSQIIDKTKCNDQAEISRVCGDCGKYSCMPRPGFSGSFCCSENYEFQCCQAGSVALTTEPAVPTEQCPKEKVQQICGCDTYKCRHNKGSVASVCCPDDFAFECCHIDAQSTPVPTTSSTTASTTTTTTTTEEQPRVEKFVNTPPLFCMLDSACNYATKWPTAKLSKRFKIREDCSHLAKRIEMKSTDADWQMSFEFMNGFKYAAFIFDFPMLWGGNSGGQ